MTLRERVEDIAVDAWSSETPRDALDAVAALIPEDAVLVTEVELVPLIDEVYQRGMDAPEAAAAVLAKLRERTA